MVLHSQDSISNVTMDGPQDRVSTIRFFNKFPFEKEWAQ